MANNETCKEVSKYSLLLHERGWVANHDGNVSCRDKRKGFWITPTAVSKRVCAPNTIVHVDGEGKVLNGKRPPSEIALHIGTFRTRKDQNAIIHAHPPNSSAFALAQKDLGEIAMPEVVVSLGARIPMVPLILPKAPDTADIIAQWSLKSDVLLLAGNGVLAMGVDLEQAYLRLELLEHYARILMLTQTIGGPRQLEAPAKSRLLELRAKAGLGAPNERNTTAAPTGGASNIASAIRPLVAEELKKILGGSQ